jgi:hypothetical protein
MNANADRAAWSTRVRTRDELDHVNKKYLSHHALFMLHALKVSKAALCMIGLVVRVCHCGIRWRGNANQRRAPENRTRSYAVDRIDFSADEIRKALFRIAVSVPTNRLRKFGNFIGDDSALRPVQHDIQREFQIPTYTSACCAQEVSAAAVFIIFWRPCRCAAQ